MAVPVCMRLRYTRFLKDARKRPFGDSNHGAARRLTVPKIVRTILSSVPRQRQRVKRQFQTEGYRKEDGITRFLGVQENPPPLCLRIPGHGIFAKCANV